MERSLRPQRKEQKEMAMLRKNKALSAFAAALLASASAMQPTAAQTPETWNTQGGYIDNAPYANYPNDGGAYDAPRDLGPDQEYGDQTYGQGAYGDQGYDPNNPQVGTAAGNDYYGGAFDENYERERAAQEWRAKYQSGYSPQANTGYSAQPYPGNYAQADQDYYAQADKIITGGTITLRAPTTTPTGASANANAPITKSVDLFSARSLAVYSAMRFRTGTLAAVRPLWA